MVTGVPVTTTLRRTQWVLIWSNLIYYGLQIDEMNALN